MLVLARKVGERVYIGNDIVVTVRRCSWRSHPVGIRLSGSNASASGRDLSSDTRRANGCSSHRVARRVAVPRGVRLIVCRFDV